MISSENRCRFCFADLRFGIMRGTVDRACRHDQQPQAEKSGATENDRFLRDLKSNEQYGSRSGKRI
jgi:hypothetical protein